MGMFGLKLDRSTLDNRLLPLVNLSENWLLATCGSNLSRIHENFLKLSCSQGKINDIKCAKHQAHKALNH